MKLVIAGLFLSLFSVLFAEETRLIELEPDQAAQIINQKDQSLKYAPKIESNVPGVRFIGDHPEHVVEDIYLANQYHGQDGLGAYLYGYSIPDIAKTEKKERSGELKGAYNYIAGDGQEIKVQYWDDGTGFHQIDNVPKIQPKQVEDNPDVKAAKEEHLRLWQEQAERNSHPIADPYANSQYAQQQPGQSQYQQYQGQGAYQPQPYGSQNEGVTHYQPQPAVHQIGSAQPYAGVNSAHAQGQPGGLYQQAYGHSQQGSQISPNSVEYSGQYSSNQQAWAKVPGAAPSAAGHGAAGASAEHDSGAGAGSGIGGGAEHASGAGIASGVGSATAHAGIGGGVGSGIGYSAGAGSSTGHAAGAGIGYSAGAGSSTGHAAGAGIGYSAGAGSSAGYGPGIGGGVGSGAGYSAGAGSSTGHAAGAGIGYSASGGSGAGYTASASHQSASHQTWDEGSEKQSQEEQEENGPPKGFFYAFDYPVGIIVGREGKNLEAYYSQSKNLYEKQLTGEAPRPSSASSSYHASA